MAIAEVTWGALVEYEGAQGVVSRVIGDECRCKGGDLYVVNFQDGRELGLRREDFTVLSLAPDAIQADPG